MATITRRNGKFKVIYNYVDENGNRKQKWETYQSLPEAKRRKLELDYKKLKGDIVIPSCRTLEELLEEYVTLYGKDKWALQTYDRNQGLIRNYINPLI